MAKARIVSGMGYAPGYGQVKDTKKKPSFGQVPNSIQSSIAAHPKYTPSTPSPGGGGGASAPSSPSVAPTAPLPPDASYLATIGGLGQTRDDTIAELEGQKTATLADYGYSATYDDAGNPTKFTVDPNNPTSRAALLQRSYTQAKRGTGNSYAAQGQLHSGALINAQDSNDFNNTVAVDQQQKSLGQILAGIIGAERQAKTAYQTGAGQAYGDMVGRAPNNPLYSPAAPSAPAPTPSATKIDPSKWVKTASTDSQGRPVRLYADGHKEVKINGAWKRV